ncbi:hypothetical protein D9M69_519620 [compost metagenome]
MELPSCGPANVPQLMFTTSWAWGVQRARMYMSASSTLTFIAPPDVSSTLDQSSCTAIRSQRLASSSRSCSRLPEPQARLITCVPWLTGLLRSHSWRCS